MDPQQHPIEHHTVQLSNHALALRGDKTAFDPVNNILFVADLHLGKAETFQSRGHAVPLGDDITTLTRLAHAATETKAERVVVLGDLFQSYYGKTSARTPNYYKKRFLQTSRS